jgi:hypothetical protein
MPADARIWPSLGPLQRWVLVRVCCKAATKELLNISFDAGFGGELENSPYPKINFASID